MKTNKKVLVAAISATLLTTITPSTVLANGGNDLFADLCGTTVSGETTVYCNLYMGETLTSKCIINVADNSHLGVHDCFVDADNRKVEINGGSNSTLALHNGGIVYSPKIKFDFDGEAPETGCVDDIIDISNFTLLAENLVGIEVGDDSCGNINIHSNNDEMHPVLQQMQLEGPPGEGVGVIFSLKNIVIKASNGSIDIIKEPPYSICNTIDSPCANLEGPIEIPVLPIIAFKSILVQAKGQSFVNGGDLAGRGRINSQGAAYFAPELDIRSDFSPPMFPESNNGGGFNPGEYGSYVGPYLDFLDGPGGPIPPAP